MHSHTYCDYIFLQSNVRKRQQLYGGDDSSSSESELERESASDDLDIAPNKVGLVSEMFPQVNREEVVLLLSLLHGNMHKLISVCLKGLNLGTIIRECVYICVCVHVCGCVRERVHAYCTLACNFKSATLLLTENSWKYKLCQTHPAT